MPEVLRHRLRQHDETLSVQDIYKFDIHKKGWVAGDDQRKPPDSVRVERSYPSAWNKKFNINLAWGLPFGRPQPPMFSLIR